MTTRGTVANTEPIADQSQDWRSTGTQQVSTDGEPTPNAAPRQTTGAGPNFVSPEAAESLADILAEAAEWLRTIRGGDGR